MAVLPASATRQPADAAAGARLCRTLMRFAIGPDAAETPADGTRTEYVVNEEKTPPDLPSEYQVFSCLVLSWCVCVCWCEEEGPFTEDCIIHDTGHDFELVV